MLTYLVTWLNSSSPRENFQIKTRLFLFPPILKPESLCHKIQPYILFFTCWKALKNLRVRPVFMN